VTAATAALLAPAGGAGRGIAEPSIAAGGCERVSATVAALLSAGFAAAALRRSA
jgi:hypothetical protein